MEKMLSGDLKRNVGCFGDIFILASRPQYASVDQECIINYFPCDRVFLYH